MIFDFIIAMVTSTIVTVITAFPAIPQAPTEITSATDWIIDTVQSVSLVMHTIFGAPLFLAILSAIIALINFERVYHLAMWVLRKLPIGSN